MLKETTLLPFQVPEYFDRFKVGETILRLGYVQAGNVPGGSSLAPGREQTVLFSHEILGFYMGRKTIGVGSGEVSGAIDVIAIDPGFGKSDYIPAKSIRALREVPDAELVKLAREIQDAIGDAATETRTSIRNLKVICGIRAIVAAWGGKLILPASSW
jgi:hypothetical protein